MCDCLTEKAPFFVVPYGGSACPYRAVRVELKNNVKRAWWKKFIQESKYNVGIDCAILMNPQTWVASGHLGGFSDPLMDCKECHERFRADQLIEAFAEENNVEYPICQTFIALLFPYFHSTAQALQTPCRL